VLNVCSSSVLSVCSSSLLSVCAVAVCNSMQQQCA
jgi:hypothetical protein